MVGRQLVLKVVRGRTVQGLVAVRRRVVGRHGRSLVVADAEWMVRRQFGRRTVLAEDGAAALLGVNSGYKEPARCGCGALELEGKTSNFSKRLFFFTGSLGASREVNAATISVVTVVVNAPSPVRFLYGELAPSPSSVASAVFEKGSGPGSGAMQAQVLPCKMFLSTTALEVP